MQTPPWSSLTMSNDSTVTRTFFGLLALAVATTMITGLRLLARIRSKVLLGAEDYLLVVSLFIMFGMVAVGGVRTLSRRFRLYIRSNFQTCKLHFVQRHLILHYLFLKWTSLLG